MGNLKSTMLYECGVGRYFDKYGNEICEGDSIRYNDGTIRQVVRTEQGFLGTDATNPKWFASGMAEPFEFGCYMPEIEELCNIEKLQ